MKIGSNRSVAWAGILLAAGLIGSGQPTAAADAVAATNAAPEGFTLPAKRETAQRRRYTVRVIPQQAELAPPIATEEERLQSLDARDQQPRLSEFSTKPMTTLDTEANQPPMRIRRSDRKSKGPGDGLWMQKTPDQILLQTEDEQETTSIELDWGWLVNDVQNAMTNTADRGRQNRDSEDSDDTDLPAGATGPGRNPVEKLVNTYDQAQGNVLTRMGLIMEPDVQPSSPDRRTSTSISGFATSREAASKESRSAVTHEAGDDRRQPDAPGDIQLRDPGSTIDAAHRAAVQLNRIGPAATGTSAVLPAPAGLPSAGGDTRTGSAWGSGWKSTDATAAKAPSPLSPGSAKPAIGTTGLSPSMTPGAGTTLGSPNKPATPWNASGTGSSGFGSGGFSLPAGNNRFEPMKPLNLGNRPTVVTPPPAPTPIQPKRPPMGSGMR